LFFIDTFRDRIYFETLSSSDAEEIVSFINDMIFKLYCIYEVAVPGNIIKKNIVFPFAEIENVEDEIPERFKTFVEEIKLLSSNEIKLKLLHKQNVYNYRMLEDAEIRRKYFEKNHEYLNKRFQLKTTTMTVGESEGERKDEINKDDVVVTDQKIAYLANRKTDKKTSREDERAPSRSESTESEVEDAKIAVDAAKLTLASLRAETTASGPKSNVSEGEAAQEIAAKDSESWNKTQIKDKKQPGRPPKETNIIASLSDSKENGEETTAKGSKSTKRERAVAKEIAAKDSEGRNKTQNNARKGPGRPARGSKSSKSEGAVEEETAAKGFDSESTCSTNETKKRILRNKKS
jgi:hypothetical protein